MGTTELSEQEFKELLADMMIDWQGTDYNLLNRNCCVFSNELCEKLGVGTACD